MSGDRPLYAKIREFIVEQIHSGVWKEETLIPSERELADQFQVSRITAKSAVLGLVNEGYLYRHRGKGTFVGSRRSQPGGSAAAPEASPAPAAAPTRRLVAFIMPWMEFQYSSLLLSGIEAGLGKRNYHVLFKRVSDRAEESRAIQALQELAVDGFIIVASYGEHFNDDIVRLALDKHPIVLVEKTLRDIRTNGVYCDTNAVGTLLAEYLSNRGYTRIGLVTYPPEFTVGVSDRLNGFRKALNRQGMEPIPDSRILPVSPSLLDGSSGDAEHAIPPAIVDYLEQNTDLEAIATVDAELAKRVGMACWQLNRRSIRIICCDKPILHPECVMPVAYIDQSPFEMGRIAANLIVEAIEQRKEPIKQMITPRLIDLHPVETNT